MNRLVNATIHSLRGLRYTIANETAVRQEAITLGLAILLGFSLSPGPAWYVAMIGVLLVLLAVELLNTAIEKALRPRHPRAPRRNRYHQGCSICGRVLPAAGRHPGMGRGDFGAFRISLNACEREGGLIRVRE